MPMGIWWRGSRVRTMVCAVGIIAPPAKPCPIRPMTISGSEWDRPHIIENAVNSSAFHIRKRRSPNTRVSHAVSGMMTISAIR
ncbi:hypothetical protein D3C72_1540320 [compost metagenome]